MIATLHCRAAAGDAVVVVTHHPALIAADDEVVDLAASAESPAEPPAESPAESPAVPLAESSAESPVKSSAEPPPSPPPSRPPSPGRHRNARGGPGMIPRSDNSNRRGALPPAATEAAGLRATSRRSGGRFVPVWGTLSGPRSSGRPGEDIGALDSGNRRSVPPGSSLQLGREDNSNKRASAATESGARARRARRRRRAVPPGGTGLVPLRGDLAAATMQLLDGAAELAAFGADGRAFGTVQDKGGRVGEATIRSGSARGAGAAVSALAAGAAVCGVLAVAVPEVRADGLAGVLLAVVALTPLAAHVFDSTLEANLRLAKPSATAAELRSALARARLLIWVDSLPLGLATQVGEHGARLSSGQRLALARVLLRDLPVVILDEPAEHLDEATAEELTRALLSAVAGRTVTLITHRPVAPGSVDQVLRLNDGRLLPAVQAAWQPA